MPSDRQGVLCGEVSQTETILRGVTYTWNLKSNKVGLPKAVRRKGELVTRREEEGGQDGGVR